MLRVARRRTTSRCGRRCASRSIRLVGVRHEQTAAYAADGFARATGPARRRADHDRARARRTRWAPSARRGRRARRSLVIATDIPSALRRPGELPRHPARDARPGGDVRAGRRRRRTCGARGRARRPTPPRRGLVALSRRRGRCTWRSRPTCWPPRLPRATLDRHAGRSAGAGRPALGRGGRARSTRAERPLLWVGRRRARRGHRGRRAGRAPGAPVFTTYGARGRAPARPPVPGRAAAARAGRGRAVGRGRRRARDRLGPRRRPDPELRQPQPQTLIAVTSTRADAVKNYRATSARGRRGRGHRGARRARAPRATGSTRSPSACASVRAERLRRSSTPTALRFLDAIRFALPADGVLVADMCIPGYWLAGLPHARGAARAADPARLGHARLRVPGGARRRARRRAARSSRSPATAASCSPAASSPRWRRSRSP